MREKAFVVILLALVVGMGLGVYHSATTRQQTGLPQTLMGTVWPEPRPLSEFQLSDHRGRVFGPDELRGHWTLMFFGYTSCPDVCPTAMMTLRDVMAALAESGAGLPRVVLVSVDPERDDAETLGEYVTYFGEDFLGVRGEDRKLDALARQIGVMYIRDPADEYGRYDVAHSSSIFLVDPEVRMYASFSPPHDTGDIVEKFVAMRQRYEHGGPK